MKSFVYDTASSVFLVFVCFQLSVAVDIHHILKRDAGVEGAGATAVLTNRGQFNVNGGLSTMSGHQGQPSGLSSIFNPGSVIGGNTGNGNSITGLLQSPIMLFNGVSGAVSAVLTSVIGVLTSPFAIIGSILNCVLESISPGGGPLSIISGGTNPSGSSNPILGFIGSPIAIVEGLSGAVEGILSIGSNLALSPLIIVENMLGIVTNGTVGGTGSILGLIQGPFEVVQSLSGAITGLLSLGSNVALSPLTILQNLLDSASTGENSGGLSGNLTDGFSVGDGTGGITTNNSSDAIVSVIGSPIEIVEALSGAPFDILGNVLNGTLGGSSPFGNQNSQYSYDNTQYQGQ